MLLTSPLATVMLACILHQCFGQRTCRNSSSPIASAVVDVRYEEILRGTVDNFKLFARLNWTVQGVNDDEYDGFLVRLMQARNYDRIQPVDDCEASSTQVWIKTKDCVRRKNTTAARCPDDLEAGGQFCPCDKANCPPLEGIRCSGTPSMMLEHRLRGYLAIPNTRRSIEYPIEFNIQYLFGIFLYRRQFLGSEKKHNLPNNWACADTVAHAYGLNLLEADQKCCLSNAPAISPLDLKEGELVLDRRTKTLNLTFSWIPPRPNKDLNGVLTVVRFMSEPPSWDSEYIPQMTNPETEGVIDENEKCALDTRRQTATAYNLLPNLDYKIHIISSYDGEWRYPCQNGNCGFGVRIRTNIDPCDTKWTSCEAGFHCVVIEDNQGQFRVPETKCVPGILPLPIPSLPGSNASSLATTSSTGTINSETERKSGTASDHSRFTNTSLFGHTSVSLTTDRPSSTDAKNYRTSTDTAFNDSREAIGNKQGSCASKRGYCHKNAICVVKFNVSEPSCACSEGLVGNGISSDYGGTGCAGCPLATRCDTMASCVSAEPSSSDEYICRCDDAYYGDGLKSGSGCSSRARRTATIVVPVVLCGILLLIVLIWCVCNRRRQKFNGSDNIRLY